MENYLGESMTSWNMMKFVQQDYGGDGPAWLQSVRAGRDKTSGLPTHSPALLPHHISTEETRPLILSH